MCVNKNYGCRSNLVERVAENPSRDISVTGPMNRSGVIKNSDSIKGQLKSSSSTKRYVQHDYHDHSQDTPSGEETFATDGCSSPSNEKHNSRLMLGNKKDVHHGTAMLFPFKLHKLLETVEVDGLANIISWQPHGRAFKIHNSKQFLAKLMPIYFHQTKIASFRRQLNLYGFLRITQGRDKGAYYHELFLRGMKFLTSRFIRQKVKGTMVKCAASPATEPDFYSMPFVGCAYCSSKKTASCPESSMSSTNVSSAAMYSSTIPTSLAEKRSKPKTRGMPPRIIVLSGDEKSNATVPFHLPDSIYSSLLQEEWDVDTFSLDEMSDSMGLESYFEDDETN